MCARSTNSKAAVIDPGKQEAIFDWMICTFDFLMDALVFAGVWERWDMACTCRNAPVQKRPLARTVFFHLWIALLLVFLPLADEVQRSAGLQRFHIQRAQLIAH